MDSPCAVPVTVKKRVRNGCRADERQEMQSAHHGNQCRLAWIGEIERQNVAVAACGINVAGVHAHQVRTAPADSLRLADRTGSEYWPAPNPHRPASDFDIARARANRARASHINHHRSLGRRIRGRIDVAVVQRSARAVTLTGNGSLATPSTVITRLA